jgi:hypothetical protein
MTAASSGRFQIATHKDLWYVHDTEKGLYSHASSYKDADKSCYTLNNKLIVITDWKDWHTRPKQSLW